MSILLENGTNQNVNSALFSKHRFYSFVKNFLVVNPDELALSYAIPKVDSSFLRIESIQISFVNAIEVSGATYTDSNDFAGYFKLNIGDNDRGQTFLSHILPIQKKFIINNVGIFSDSVITNNLTLNIPSVDMNFMFNGALSAAPEIYSYNVHFLISVIDYPENDYQVTPAGVIPKYKKL